MRNLKFIDKTQFKACCNKDSISIFSNRLGNSNIDFSYSISVVFFWFKRKDLSLNYMDYCLLLILFNK
jgi:hypothetical protein